MHIVERVASMLGVEATDWPMLDFEFYPLPFDKYISVYNEAVIPSNYYDYLEQVFSDIREQIKDFRVIQFINDPNERRLHGATIIDHFTYSQLAYLIKNSSLHICTDALTHELAGILDTPSISLIGNRYPENSYSWYGASRYKHVILNHLSYKKPTFSLIENPKSINGILPEDIAEQVLSLLGISHTQFEKKTLFVGSRMHELPICDFIPNFACAQIDAKDWNVRVRLDKCFDESKALPICLNQKHEIVTSNPLSKEFALRIRGNCNKIIYYVSPQTQAFNIADLANLGFSLDLYYQSGKKDDDTSFNLLDFGIIKESGIECPEAIRKTPNLTFKSNLLVLSGGKRYPSYAHLDKGVEESIINHCIDSDLFWKDDCFFRILGENKHE